MVEGTRRAARSLRHRGCRLSVITLVAAALAVCAAACSSGSGSGSSASAPLSLTVADPGALTDFAPLYIAQQAGYFKQQGVNVKIISGPATDTISLLTSGQADLDLYTVASALETAEEGIDTEVIYASASTAGSALVTSPGIATLADLQHKAGCRLAAPAAGSQTYANAILLKSALNLPCTVVTAPSTQVLASGVQSGQYDAGIVVYTTALQVVAGGGHMLVDPSQASYQAKYAPNPQVPGNAIFGISSVLSKNKEAVTRFLKAYGQAEKAAAGGSSPTDLANLLLKDPGFAGQTAASLATGLKFGQATFDLGYDGPPGYIGSSNWPHVLDGIERFGLANYSPSAAVNSYSSRVDMSYYDAAFGTPS
jgi:NitT/TauT family transport system substrate-binding protein